MTRKIALLKSHQLLVTGRVHYLLLTGSAAAAAASPLIPDSETRAFFAGGLKNASKVLFAVDMLRTLIFYFTELLGLRESM
jgi:hypothetical protein